MDPHTGALPGLKVMVDRATRWKFAWQHSPLAACPQEVKDGVEDGTKVGGSRSPALSRRRQNRDNPAQDGHFYSAIFFEEHAGPGSSQEFKTHSMVLPELTCGSTDQRAV